MNDWTGKVCVITGAGSGIGAGLARYALRQGMQVIGADIDTKALEEVTVIPSADTKDFFTAYTLDVSDADQVSRFADWVFNEYGQVHLFFNNAGVLVDGKSWERPLSDWRWIMEVNVMGVIHGIHYFIPRMLQQKAPARIINTASIGGLLGGGSYLSPYQASKHAVVAISESLYKELALEDSNVTASVLCPAEVATLIWHSDRLRPENEQVVLGADEQRFHDAVAGNVANGPSPDAFAAQVFAGVEAEKFWLIPDLAFTPLLQQRTEDIVATRNPQISTEIDFNR